MTVPNSEATVGPNDQSHCPQCGGELHMSALYPHGRDSGGAIRKAKVCLEEDLSFGLTSDGAWSIPLVPINLNESSASHRRSKRHRQAGVEGIDVKYESPTSPTPLEGGSR
jgi:hypothetical protein